MSRFDFTTHVDPVSPPSGIHRIVRRIHYAIFVPTMATDAYLVEATGTAPVSVMLIPLGSSTSSYLYHSIGLMYTAILAS